MADLKGVGIGAGYFSEFHYDAWSRQQGVEITAVCDIDLHRARRAAERFGIRNYYDDVGRMLDSERPDFVDIITRPESHFDLVREAVSRSTAIICQKPLAPSYDEAQQIVAAAMTANVPLMVHDNFRFQPWHREIKRLISKGVIGNRLHSLICRSRPGDGWQSDAYLARQPYFRTMPRLLIYETGVHFIDTFRFLAGEIVGVYATLRRLNSEILGEDAGIVLFEFASGAEGIWDANRCNESACDDPRYTFCELLVEGNGGSIRLYQDGRLSLQRLGDNEVDHDYEHNHRGFAGECVLATQTHFVSSIRTGQPFETNGVDYLKTLAVQEAVYESAAKRMPVRGLQNEDER